MTEEGGEETLEVSSQNGRLILGSGGESRAEREGEVGKGS